ncbi:hypothetical protein HPB50_022028 [Hyalomma asiaticum]|uniref:Uncharacterized protein n=1 Tax=Hyalomma asiaticum TaxID=266040 RepID=A0ACB7T4R0_HYAAI|nr:hypothetical protein HPB50_022028 [Hyalomma asiaticum]
MKLTCWEQYISSAALGSKFVQRLSPTAERDDFPDCEELCQEVSKLSGNGAAESDMTFLEYALC